MMLRVIFLIFAISLAGVCNGQDIGLDLRVGYSTYSMRHLRDFQHKQYAHPLPLKVVNDFPANISAGFNLFFWFREDIETGIEYSNHKTLGRVHYSDYSGEIGIDQTAKAHVLGIFTRCRVLQRNNFALKVSGSLTAWMSSVEFVQYYRIGNDLELTELSVVSTNVGVALSIEPVYKISEHFSVGLKLGGMIDVPRPLHLKKEKDVILEDSNGNEVYAHWAGLRSEFYLSMPLGNRRSSNK